MRRQTSRARAASAPGDSKPVAVNPVDYIKGQVIGLGKFLEKFDEK